MEAKIEVFGDEKLALEFEHSGEEVLNMTPVMERILFDMFRVEDAIFASQGRRGGGSWRSLKPETIKRKAASGYPPEILIESGNLLQSVTNVTSDMAVGNDFIKFGTSHPGAKTQQFGDATRGVPARPFIRFTSFDKRRWEGWIADHLMRGFRDDTAA